MRATVLLTADSVRASRSGSENRCSTLTRVARLCFAVAERSTSRLRDVSSVADSAPTTTKSDFVRVAWCGSRGRFLSHLSLNWRGLHQLLGSVDFCLLDSVRVLSLVVDTEPKSSIAWVSASILRQVRSAELHDEQDSR